MEGGIKISRCDEYIIFQLIGDHKGVSEFGEVNCAGYISAYSLEDIFAMAPFIDGAVLLHPEKGFGERPFLLFFCYL